MNCAALSSNAASLVASGTSNCAVKPTRSGWKSSKGGEAWRTALIASLEKELKTENKRFSLQHESRAQHVQLIRYAVSENLPSVISVVYQRVRSIRNRGKLTDDDDQFISFALTILQKSIELSLLDEQAVNGPEMLSTFFSFANLWDRMVMYGNDMRISSALLYNTFDRWSQLRAADGSSDEIDQILSSMEKRLRKLVDTISLEESRLFLSSSERQQLLQLIAELDANTGRRRKILKEDNGYDKIICEIQSQGTHIWETHISSMA